MNWRDMPAFDQLPETVRRAMADMDFNFNTNEVLTLHRMGYSDKIIIDYLRKICAKKHRKDAATGKIMGGQR